MDSMIDRPGAGEAATDRVGRLLAPHLDALFWRPSRLGVDSAWYGHLPFANWVVAAARPRLVVELGTHAGVSYAAFCDAVQRSRLDARCVAVDTWRGDEHAGFYGEEVFRDLASFHDARFGGFSTLLRSTFDDALGCVEDGAVDLLHIDGRHTYDDVRHDFLSWRPKLSSRAVVLLHDTAVRDRGFGVWRLWAELACGLPHFEFLHSFGLGVLCVGAEAPGPLRGLCALTEDPAAVAQTRECFASLGERWVIDRAQLRVQQALAEQRRHADAVGAKFAELVEYTGTLEKNIGAPPARAELRSFMARTVAAEQQQQLAAQRAADAEARAAAADARTEAALDRADASRRELDAIAASRTWRVASRMRAASELVRGSHRHPLGARADGARPLPTVAQAVTHQPAAAPARRRRVLFASGEPKTPGNTYRCERYATSARGLGWDAACKPVGEIDADDLRDTDVVMLWRVTWSEHIEGVIEHTHMFGGRIGLDLDDLMIRLDLARVEYIDAIRSINWSEAHVRGMFAAVMNVLGRVDFATATTPELAAEMRRWQKAAYVLPNGFDDATWQRSRRAARARAASTGDGLVRIGYASGSRTHQRDFAAAVDALVAVLRARPQTRLVLFHSDADDQALLTPDEFPDLAALADRIEWRSLVPLEALPDELARFDINIVPLQIGNPFVEAKSELKYFEAAIAGVATIASPTGPYRRAIVDGQTGLLAEGAVAWETALLRLVDDPQLRQRLARAACADVLWRFGPQRQARLLQRFLAQHQGGPQPDEGAALGNAFALGLAAEREDAPRLAPLAETETLFSRESETEAAVTVVVASFNYADFIQQALESVRLQTLDMLDLIVVDDCSTDPETMHQILDWAHTHAGRFNRLLVLRHVANAGLGGTRNTGFAWADTSYVLPLDADNRLRPQACEQLLAALDGSEAAYAYPRLQHFGADEKITGGERYEPQRLVGGNYIDAMALMARWAWSAAGGYYVQRDAMGWEDFSLWCRMAELGFWGQAVGEVLAEYRVHADSMVNAITETTDNKRAMVAYVEARHPWLEILSREPFARG